MTKKKASKKVAPRAAKKPRPKPRGGRADALSLIERTAATARAKNERSGRELIATIRSKIAQVEECFYEIGVALRELRAPAVLTALGAPSFEALIATVEALSPSTAYRLIRIVEHFTERTAISLTQTKALALITYVEATPESDDAETLARQDAEIGGIPISKQTPRGILEAAAEARPPSARPEREGETDARTILATLTRTLEASGGDVRARLVRRKGKFFAVVELPIELAPSIAIAKKRRVPDASGRTRQRRIAAIVRDLHVRLP